MQTLKHKLVLPSKFFEKTKKQLQHVQIQKNALFITPPLGEGQLNYVVLQKGLWIMQSKFSLTEPLTIKRKSSKKNHSFALNFYLFPGEIQHKNESHNLGLNHVNIMLNSAASKLSLFIPKNTPIHVINIGFTRDWLVKNILVDDNTDRLAQLFLSNQPFFLAENLDYRFKSILENVDLKTNGRLKLFSTVLQLLDAFITKLQKRESKTLIPNNIYYSDFQKIISTRNTIDQNIQTSIPIETLAKQAGMSLSKYKTLFKQIIGSTPYQYFLNNRMEKAMELLRENHYPISQVAFELGYSNPSKFSETFKKYYGKLPSEIQKETL